jgi:predicted RND superfamily exporter protein
LTPALLRRLTLPIFLATGALTAWLGYHAATIGIEHDNASLRTTDVEELRTYAAFRGAFGNDEDILVAVAHPSLLDATGLTLVADLTKDIAAMDGVARVWSLATAEELVEGETGAEPRPLLLPPWNAADIRPRAEAALARNPDFHGWLVSEDRRVAGIVVEIEDRPDDTGYRARLVRELRALAPRVAREGGELHLTGVPVQKIDVSGYVDRDQKILLPAAVLLLGVTLALFFRHFSGVLVPVAVAGITVAWTQGLYAATGHATNAITALLPPVLLVIALATTIHVYDAWLEDREGGEEDDGYARSTRAVRAVFVPGLLCAVTTAQGFFSLTLGDLPAVRQFGVFAAFGAVAAFVVAMTVAPAALAHVRPPPRHTARGHGWTRRLLEASSDLATGRPGAVLFGFAIVTVIAIAGLPMLRTNTDLVGFLRQNAPLRIDTEWIDANLGGTLPLEFLLRRADGSPVPDLQTVKALEEIERRARAREHVAGTTSIVALVRQVHRAETKSGRLELPADAETLQEGLDLLDESGHALVRRFAAPEMTALRLTVRLRSVGSAVSGPLVRAIRDDARELLPPGVELLPTGTLWEVVRDSDHLVENQVRSFGSAIVLVVAAIGLLLRSVAFTLVAMIPNVMPILWTGGLMGYAGIDLSTGTAMIASAVLGLVVDDTIHYLAYYRRTYDGDAVAAIRRTTLAVGAPVTVASTSLVLGFWVGALGSFLPTIYFSLLTGLTMITGVLCDLLVLPASLVLLDRMRRRGA